MAFSPSSYDSTQAALFQVSIDKIPNAVYYTFSVNIPGISFGEAIQPTPTLDIKLPGDKLVFEPFILNFVVSEDLKNYIEIHNWLKGLGKPETTDQYKNWVRRDPNKTKYQNKYSNINVSVLTNKLNPKTTITLYDAYPIALSPLTYDSTITDVVPLMADATFNYTYYDIFEL